MTRKTTILFELFNLSVPRPTGIGTYARNLCGAAHDLGFHVEGLMNTSRALDTKDPILTEISFFDARNRKPTVFDRYIAYNFARVIGAPFGAPVTELPKNGIVVNTKLDILSRIYVARAFMEFSRFHFKRYNSSMRLRLPSRPDIFHTTQAVPLYAPGAKNIYTIHDLIPLRLPQTTQDDKKFFLNMVRYLGKTADRIVTVSEASRQDIIRIGGVAPEKVVNTYQAVSFPSEAIGLSDAEAAKLVEGAFGLKKDEYYLFFGALEPKKNVGRLIDAYMASGSARPLVLAGGLGWDYKDDLEKIEENQTGMLRIEGRRIRPDERIRRLDHLPLLHLVCLIRCARAVIFPSLYEGFGLPVLEAMFLGTPVITSSVSSLIEVAGDAAMLVDPYNIIDLANAIRHVDGKDDLRAQMSSAGRAQAAKFSPDIYRDRLKAVYADLMQG